jgi:FKBP-type peptidyl-prolyl cis-trans isomerase FklB
MKVKTFLIILTIFTGTTLLAQPMNDSVSYAFGIQMANSLQKNGILNEIDFNSLMEAFTDVKSDNPKLTDDQAIRVLQNYITTFTERKRKENEAAGKTFLENNAKKQGVIALPSGLQYKVLEKGKILKPKVTDTVEVHYKGFLVDGTEFESSLKMTGTPVRFLLNDVISGWKEGLQYVAEGGKIILYIPPHLAYGERNMPGSPIPPSSTLIFEIELFKIIPSN